MGTTRRPESLTVLSIILSLALIVSLWGNWTLFCQREEAMKELTDQKWANIHARRELRKIQRSEE